MAVMVVIRRIVFSFFVSLSGLGPLCLTVLRYRDLAG
jgi:hypothetical protein